MSFEKIALLVFNASRKIVYILTDIIMKFFPDILE